jgi:hypothetical protein
MSGTTIRLIDVAAMLSVRRAEVSLSVLYSVFRKVSTGYSANAAISDDLVDPSLIAKKLMTMQQGVCGPSRQLTQAEPRSSRLLQRMTAARPQGIDRGMERTNWSCALFFFEGFPNLQLLDPRHTGQTVKRCAPATSRRRYSPAHSTKKLRRIATPCRMT